MKCFQNVALNCKLRHYNVAFMSAEYVRVLNDWSLVGWCRLNLRLNPG